MKTIRFIPFSFFCILISIIFILSCGSSHNGTIPPAEKKAAVNSAPVASAGNVVLNVTTDSLVMLDGSKTYDPDQDALLYTWRFISIPVGSNAVFYDNHLVRPTFTPDKEGTYTAELVVSDGTNTSRAEVIIIAKPDKTGFALRKDGQPVRIPPWISLQQTEPASVFVNDFVQIKVPLVLSQFIQPSAVLKLQVKGGRNNGQFYFRLQTTDPNGYGYVTAKTESGSSLLVTPSLTQDGTFIIQVPDGGLPAGSTLRVILGEGKGMRIQETKMFNKMIILYLGDLNEQVSVDWNTKNQSKIVAAATLDILGKIVLDHINAYAPSVIAPGESFSILVRPEDKHHNLTSEPQGAYSVSNGNTILNTTIEQIPNSTAVRLNVSGLSLTTEGVYRLKITNIPSNKETFTNPVICRTTPDFRPYWGMIHGHTEMSDGWGSITDYFRQIRDEAGLQFAAVSDHDGVTETTDEMWNIIAAKVKQFHEPGKFVTFLGYEWGKWKYNGYGDRNVYFIDDFRPMYRSNDAYYPKPEDLFSALEKELAMVIPHHPATGNFCNWKNHDQNIERLVEIFQVRGSFECAGNEYPITPNTKYVPVPEGYVCNALKNGWRVGFSGGGDNHGGLSGLDYPKGGLMSVFSEGLTREKLWSGMWERRVVATTGPRMYLYYTIEGKPMGSEIIPSRYPGLLQQRRFHIEFHGTAPIERIDIIRNNSIVHSIYAGGSDYTGEWEDKTRLETIFMSPTQFTTVPFVFYYVRVLQQDGEIAWASPVWILLE